MIELFTLLILFQIKHFLCDYPLQTAYMLGKANTKGWILPLATHAGVHALFTFIIVIVAFQPPYFLDTIVLGVILALVDFIVHFIVDRIKASPSLGGRFKPSQPYFWWALGAD